MSRDLIQIDDVDKIKFFNLKQVGGPIPVLCEKTSAKDNSPPFTLNQTLEERIKSAKSGILKTEYDAVTHYMQDKAESGEAVAYAITFYRPTNS